MKKKNLLVAGTMILLILAMNQFANGQTCSGNKVYMSYGCACSCQSKCVNRNQVQKMLNEGWYYGGCSLGCCSLSVATNQINQPPKISGLLPKTEKVLPKIIDIPGLLDGTQLSDFLKWY